MNRGTLYIVGTPIGNLGDITLRALDTLKQVDLILAEDTRQTLKLLRHFEIEKHMISYHRHNEEEKIHMVASLLEEGKNIALVSDAGMPIISDPGQNLVRYLVTNAYQVETIPGVTALITGLVKSGMDSTRFAFEGFLSVSKKQRKERLQSLVQECRTMIFYEAPHKILATLKDMECYLGNRNICIARELTKIYEEYQYVTIKGAIEKIEKEPLRGEIVLIIEGKKEQELAEEKMKIINQVSTIELVTKYMMQGSSKKEAIKQVAKEKGVPKNQVYQECIDLKEE